jgi:two-component system response regulator AtoC
MGTSVRKVSSEVLALFKKFPWHGNIRELENTIERGLVLADGDAITLECLPDKLRNFSETETRLTASGEFSTQPDALSIKQQVRNLEIHLISKALEKTHGNRTHAAKLLEISHRTLLYKLKEYELADETE